MVTAPSSGCRALRSVDGSLELPAGRGSDESATVSRQPI
jgi:hypothetical protein